MMSWEVKARQRDINVLVGVLERKVNNAHRLVRKLLAHEDIEGTEKENLCSMLKDCFYGIDSALDPVDNLEKTLAKRLTENLGKRAA